MPYSESAMIRQQVARLLHDALLKEGWGGYVSARDVKLERPQQEGHGDYATNVALVLAPLLGKNPVDLARRLKARLEAASSSCVREVEVADPGFVNIRISYASLLGEAERCLKEREQYGRSDLLRQKTLLVEHTSPNTIKTLHVGHVRNNVTGMALANIFEAAGAKVVRDVINNDRGIHVMKANWAYLQYGQEEEIPHLPLEPTVPWRDRMKEWAGWSFRKKAWKKPGAIKGDAFLDRFYVLGVQAEAQFPKAKEEMQEMLRAWEEGEKSVRALWKVLREWTLKGFSETYRALKSRHDHQWFESDLYRKGKELVQEGLKKGVFRTIENGAVLSSLSSFGLSDAIVLRADGTSLYHTQDLALIRAKKQKFPSDRYLWVVGPEQTLYLKQLFAMAEQLGLGAREEFEHVSFGSVDLKGEGKMSSRKGNVVSADQLMREMIARAHDITTHSGTGRSLGLKAQKAVEEAVGIGAIKYGILKVARMTDIHFDMRESLALEGDSAPYIQYTHARCQSILAKAKTFRAVGHGAEMHPLDEALLRQVSKFPEMVEDAAMQKAPNLICLFAFDLARSCNALYASLPVLKAEDSQRALRLLLVGATAQTLRNALSLLGIASPDRM